MVSQTRVNVAVKVILFGLTEQWLISLVCTRLTLSCLFFVQFHFGADLIPAIVTSLENRLLLFWEAGFKLPMQCVT